MRKIQKLFAVLLALSFIFGNFNGVFSANAQDSQNSKAKVWDFDSEDDLTYFQSSYWSSAQSYTVDSNVTDRFDLSDGKLKVRDDSPTWPNNWPWGTDGLASLTLDDPNMSNFDFTVKYKHGDFNNDYKDFGTVFLSFRGKTPGQPFIPNAGWITTYGSQADGSAVAGIGEHYGTGKLHFFTEPRSGGLENNTAICDARWEDNDSSHSEAFSKYYTLRVRVVGDTMQSWLDGTELPDQTLSNKISPKGYISITFVNTRGYIDSVSVTRLDKDGNEVDFETEITEPVDSIKSTVGQTYDEILKVLPSNVSVKSGAANVDIPVSGWNCDNYDEDTAGTYIFKANSFTLPRFIKANEISIEVTTTSDMDAITKTWNFDSEDDLTDFRTSYYSSASYSQDSAVSDRFNLSAGALKVRDDSPIWPDNWPWGTDGIASLTLDDPNMGNFDYTVRYKHGDFNDNYKDFGTVYLSFREKTPGQPFIPVSNNWCPTHGSQADGTVVPSIGEHFAHGKLFFAKEPITAGLDALTPLCDARWEDNDASHTEAFQTYHTLRIRVIGNTVESWIDGVRLSDQTLSDRTPDAGYISINFVNTRGYVDSVSVTRLDENGNEVPFETEITDSVDDLEFCVGQSYDTVLKFLPSTVNVKTGAAFANVPVSGWVCNDFNSDIAGTYIFEADSFTLPNYIKANKICVNVTLVPENEASTKIWDFDSVDDLDDFVSTYHASTTGYIHDNKVTDRFSVSVDNSSITNITDGTGTCWGMDGMSALTLNDPYLKNVDVEVRFKRPDDMGLFHIGLRGSTPGQVYKQGLGSGTAWQNCGTQVDGSPLVHIWMEHDNGALNAAVNNQTYSIAGSMWDKNDGSVGYQQYISYHTLRLRLVGTTLETWLDGSKCNTVNLDSVADKAGYISLICADTKASIDYLKVTRLDAEGKNTAIMKKFSADETTVNLPVGLAEQKITEFLPETVYGLVDGQRCSASIGGWSSVDYNAEVAGTYTFTSTSLKSSVLVLENPVSINVKTGSESVAFAMDNLQELKDNFYSSYSDDIAESEPTEVDITSKWILGSSSLLRMPAINPNDLSSTEKMAILTYNKEYLRNFELNVDYIQGNDSWKWPMIGIGSQKLGKFAYQVGGGIAFYTEQEGNQVMWCNMFDSEDNRFNRKNNDCNYDKVYDRNAKHHMKMIVNGNSIDVYVDGASVWHNDFPDYNGGYIYLAANANSAQFDNLVITKLPGIQSLEPVSPITVTLGTAENDIPLPKTVNTIDEKGISVAYPVTWSALNYSSDKYGNYLFTGTVNAENQPGKIRVSTVVTVNDKNGPENIRNINFNETDGLSEFTSCFGSDVTNGDIMCKISAEKKWTIRGNILSRTNSTASTATSSKQNVAALFIGNKKYRNFELSVNYKQGADSWKWAMVGFGAKEKDSFATNVNGGIVAYVEQEGIQNFWSRAILTEDNRVRNSESPIPDYDRNAWHSMRLVVSGNTAYMYIDGSSTPWTLTLPMDYMGGYIYLAVNANTAQFANLNIIDLDDSVIGDATGDGKLDIRDLVRLKKAGADDSVAIAYQGDYNHDYVINSQDLTNTRKSLLGIGKVETTVLTGKSALFLGDSVSFGEKDPGNFSWGGRIAAMNGMNAENQGRSGYALSNNNRAQIVSALPYANENYDYVIMEGGFNDICENTPLGTFEPNNFTDISSRDQGTILGGMEYLFYSVKQKFPNAKLGFIIIYKANEENRDMSELSVAAKKLCEKWGVNCLDIYNDDEFHKKFPYDTCLADTVHPTAVGYDVLANYINDWMKSF